MASEEAFRSEQDAPRRAVRAKRGFGIPGAGWSEAANPGEKPCSERHLVGTDGPYQEGGEKSRMILLQISGNRRGGSIHFGRRPRPSARRTATW